MPKDESENKNDRAVYISFVFVLLLILFVVLQGGDFIKLTIGDLHSKNFLSIFMGVFVTLSFLSLIVFINVVTLITVLKREKRYVSKLIISKKNTGKRLEKYFSTGHKGNGKLIKNLIPSDRTSESYIDHADIIISALLLLFIAVTTFISTLLYYRNIHS